jgi:hypothetical protein
VKQSRPFARSGYAFTVGYPPKRGTLCRINDDATYLFTTGHIPEWQTYLGMHIPVPLKILTDRDIDIVRAAADVLECARISAHELEHRL